MRRALLVGIDEVSHAQEIQAKAHSREQVRLVSDAFDTEVTRAALAFELPPMPASSMHAELENIWTKWNREAPWPHIIAGVAFLESGANGWRTRSLGDPGTFDIQSILQSGASAGSLPTTGFAGRLSQDLFLAGRPSLLRPLPALPESHGQPRMNWVLIRFNEGYLAGTLFPLLLEKYTSPEDRMEFRIEIRIGAHPNTPTDIIVADLLHYRPD